MSFGYGKKIYKKRRSRLPIILGVIILMGAVFSIRYSLSEREKDPKPVSMTILNSEPESIQNQNSLPDASGIRLKEKTAGWKESDADESPRQSSPDSDLTDQAMLGEADRLFNQRHYKNALEILKKIPGNEWTILTRMGLCYYHLEDYENALSHLQDALATNRDDWATLKYLAFTHYKMDNLENSLELTQKALDIQKQGELVIFRDRLIREIGAMKGYSGRKTPHFKIIFSRFEHGDIKHTIRDILEDAYREIGRQLDYFPDRMVTAILYNDEAFFDITRLPSWVGGLYDGKIRLPIKGIENKEEMLRKVLFHEYTHALIHDITPSCPMWINEGLAEYFSMAKGPDIGQIFPLNQLEKRFPGNNTRDIALAYLESHSAVSHLISKFDLFRLRDYLFGLGRGENNHTAFKSAFSISYEDFVHNWGRE